VRAAIGWVPTEFWAAETRQGRLAQYFARLRGHTHADSGLAGFHSHKPNRSTATIGDDTRATQVASHAQKFFLRLNSELKRKQTKHRRSSMDSFGFSLGDLHCLDGSGAECSLRWDESDESEQLRGEPEAETFGSEDDDCDEYSVVFDTPSLGLTFQINVSAALGSVPARL
jgi:hypothetical protein